MVFQRIVQQIGRIVSIIRGAGYTNRSKRSALSFRMVETFRKGLKKPDPLMSQNQLRLNLDLNQPRFCWSTHSGKDFGSNMPQQARFF